MFSSLSVYLKVFLDNLLFMNLIQGLPITYVFPSEAINAHPTFMRMANKVEKSFSNKLDNIRTPILYILNNESEQQRKKQLSSS